MVRRVAGSIGYYPGGIRSLADLISDRDTATALNADLMSVGLRLSWLGTDELPWSDLWDFTVSLPADSAVGRLKNKLKFGISLTQILLQEIVNNGRIATVQRGAQRRRIKPKLLDLQKPQAAKIDGLRHKLTPMSREEIDHRLGWNKKRTTDG